MFGMRACLCTVRVYAHVCILYAHVRVCASTHLVGGCFSKKCPYKKLCGSKESKVFSVMFYMKDVLTDILNDDLHGVLNGVPTGKNNNTNKKKEEKH